MPELNILIQMNQVKCVRINKKDKASKGIKIEIRNEQKEIPLNLKEIRTSIEKALNLENKFRPIAEGQDEKDIHLSICFVDETKIRELNFLYRKIDSPTDVLSFDYSQTKDVSGIFSACSVVRPMTTAVDGEIVISPQVVKKNAKRFRASWESEMYRCLIHGILHLLSYDDQNISSRCLMKKKEAELLHLISKV